MTLLVAKPCVSNFDNFIADHIRIKALVISLTIGNTPKVEALAQTEHECNLNLYSYLVMKLDFRNHILAIPLQIHINRHLPWDTLEISWSSILLKLSNTDSILPTLVTVYPMDKYIVRSIMDNNELIFCISLLVGVT